MNSIITNEYAEFIETLKKDIQRTQIKAALAISHEIVSPY
jgi:hypothetical protein